MILILTPFLSCSSASTCPLTFVPAISNSIDLKLSQLPLAVGDFNNDDQLDIAIINYNKKNVDILLGYRNGTFPKEPTFSIAI